MTYLGLPPAKRLSNPLGNGPTRIFYIAEPLFSEKPEDFEFSYMKDICSAINERALESTGHIEDIEKNQRITGHLLAYRMYHDYVMQVLSEKGSEIKENYNIIFISPDSVSRPLPLEDSLGVDFIKLKRQPNYGSRTITSVFTDNNYLTKRIIEAEEMKDRRISMEGTGHFEPHFKKTLYIPIKHVIEAFTIEERPSGKYAKNIFDQEFIIKQRTYENMQNQFLDFFDRFDKAQESFEDVVKETINPIKDTNKEMEQLGRSILGDTEKSKYFEFVREFSRARVEFFDSSKAYRMLRSDYFHYANSLQQLHSMVNAYCYYNRFLLSKMYGTIVDFLVPDGQEIFYFGAKTGFGYGALHGAAGKRQIHNWPLFEHSKMSTGGVAQNEPISRLVQHLLTKNLGPRKKITMDDLFGEDTLKRFKK